MAISQVQAFVLQAKPFGESHRLLTLLAKEQGLLRAAAHGAAKPQHTLCTVTQPLTEGAFLIRQTGQGLGSVVQGMTLRSFSRLHEDPVRLAYALAVGELIIHVVGDDEQMALSVRALYEPLGLLLRRLTEGLAPGIGVAALIVRALPFCGLSLRAACARCSAVLASSSRFSLHSGGLLCDDCASLAEEKMAWPLGEGAGRVLCALAATPLEKIGKVTVRPATEREVVELLQAWVSDRTGVHLGALRIALAMDPRFRFRT